MPSFQSFSRFCALFSPPAFFAQISRKPPNLSRQIPIHPLAPPQFGLTPEIVKRPFAEIGDIRTFFDLVEKRAMAFVTYVRSPFLKNLRMDPDTFLSRSTTRARP